jgi:hypothetical protein
MNAIFELPQFLLVAPQVLLIMPDVIAQTGILGKSHSAQQQICCHNQSNFPHRRASLLPETLEL